MQHALAVGVGIGSVEMIDERNILQATKYAMRDAISPTDNCHHKHCFLMQYICLILNFYSDLSLRVMRCVFR